MNSDRSQARRIAREMYAQGASYNEITKKLADDGYISAVTKKAHLKGSVQYMINEHKYKKNQKATKAPADASDPLRLVRSIVESRGIADADRMTELEKLLGEVKQLDAKVSKPWVFSKNLLAKPHEDYRAFTVWHAPKPGLETGIPGHADVPKEAAKLMVNYRTSAPKLALIVEELVGALKKNASVVRPEYISIVPQKTLEFMAKVATEALAKAAQIAAGEA